jgi:APA family basic amino acid/polyamine antiporter
MLGLGLATWLRLIVWMGLGFAVYFGYGHKHSRIAHAENASQEPPPANLGGPL